MTPIGCYAYGCYACNGSGILPSSEFYGASCDTCQGRGWSCSHGRGSDCPACEMDLILEWYQWALKS
jgi:hypothetical protein